MINTIKNNLSTLSNLISQLKNEEYLHKSIYLSNATIGGHTRHIIEIAECLLNGYKTGYVDYINRVRNLEIENSRDYALNRLEILKVALNLPDKNLEVVCEIENGSKTVSSSYNRELVYNIEHIIHHLALIKVTLVELNLNIVDTNFGYAYSTIKYKNSFTKVNA